MAYVTVLNCLLLAALLPGVAFVVLLLWGRRIGRQGSGAGVAGIAIAVASFGLSLGALVLWVAADRFKQSSYVEAFTYRWMELPAAAGTGVGGAGGVVQPLPGRPADGLTAGVAIDSLTIAMFLVFTLLNVLVHIFAWGSLGDPAAAGGGAVGDKATGDGGARTGGKPRLFACLAFLNFALLGLLLANSLVQMLVFWELFSLACFFLVRLSVEKAAASLRMYIMQAAGSLAFLLGIGILASHTSALAGLGFFDSQGTSILAASIRQALDVQTSEFLYLPGSEGFLQIHWLTWAGICFLVAALARMAQFPFQTWLHGVSEAPAAITALISAGTLGAGVCLLARVYPIWTLDTRFIAAVVGGVTLAVGGAIALVQTDIRKILAWSTVSQGGYVLLFLGAGGYSAGILHLFTHGFAKTALILAAGAVLAGTGTADIRQMGGLWKRFPITAVGALLAVMTLGGVPFMSGAYSTNLGLGCVYDYAHALQGTSGRHFEILLFHVPAVFTYVTALGMGRWWWLIFGGTSRNPKIYDAAHESAFLTLPIIILAGFYAGLLYDFSGILPLIGRSVPAALLPRAGSGAGGLIVTGSDFARDTVLVDTGWAFVGLAVAVLLYLRGTSLTEKFRRLPGVGAVEFWLRERMFFDELYEGVLLPLLLGAVRLTAWLEWLGRALLRLLAGMAAWGNSLAVHMERSKAGESPEPQAPEDAAGKAENRTE